MSKTENHSEHLSPNVKAHCQEPDQPALDPRAELNATRTPQAPIKPVTPNRYTIRLDCCLLLFENGRFLRVKSCRDPERCPNSYWIAAGKIDDWMGY